MSNLNNLPQPTAGCLPSGVTDPEGISAFTLRFGTATAEAVQTGSVAHPSNSDLTNFIDGLGTYSKALKQEAPGLLGTQAIKWNFTKFLVDRDRRVVRRYAPSDKPEKLAGEIEAALD